MTHVISSTVFLLGKTLLGNYSRDSLPYLCIMGRSFFERQVRERDNGCICVDTGIIKKVDSRNIAPSAFN